MSHETFLKIFGDADIKIHNESAEDPFPAFLDGIDTTLAPFCPTSATRVLKALTLANVNSNDILVDLGSGDGRFVTAAASVFNVSRAVGIESDEQLVDQSKILYNQVLSTTTAETSDHNKAQFICGDLLKLPNIACNTNWSVIVLFLLPDHTDKFSDFLIEHYEKGARIISLVFNLNEIPKLKLIASDEKDGIFVYGKGN